MLISCLRGDLPACRQRDGDGRSSSYMSCCDFGVPDTRGFLASLWDPT